MKTSFFRFLPTVLVATSWSPALGDAPKPVGNIDEVEYTIFAKLVTEPENTTDTFGILAVGFGEDPNASDLDESKHETTKVHGLDTSPSTPCLPDATLNFFEFEPLRDDDGVPNFYPFLDFHVIAAARLGSGWVAKDIKAENLPRGGKASNKYLKGEVARLELGRGAKDVVVDVTVTFEKRSSKDRVTFSEPVDNPATETLTTGLAEVDSFNVPDFLGPVFRETTGSNTGNFLAIPTDPQFQPTDNTLPQGTSFDGVLAAIPGAAGQPCFLIEVTEPFVFPPPETPNGTARVSKWDEQTGDWKPDQSAEGLKGIVPETVTEFCQDGSPGIAMVSTDGTSSTLNVFSIDDDEFNVELLNALLDSNRVVYDLACVENSTLIGALGKAKDGREYLEFYNAMRKDQAGLEIEKVSSFSLGDANLPSDFDSADLISAFDSAAFNSAAFISELGRFGRDDSLNLHVVLSFFDRSTNQTRILEIDEDGNPIQAERCRFPAEFAVEGRQSIQIDSWAGDAAGGIAGGAFATRYVASDIPGLLNEVQIDAQGESIQSGSSKFFAGSARRSAARVLNTVVARGTATPDNPVRFLNLIGGANSPPEAVVNNSGQLTVMELTEALCGLAPVPGNASKVIRGVGTAFLDLNGDERTDAIGTTTEGKINVYLQQENGDFAIAEPNENPFSDCVIAPGAKVSIANAGNEKAPTTLYFGGNPRVVLQLQPDGSWFKLDAANNPAFDFFLTPFVCDMNGDGIDDLLLQDASQLNLYLGNADGTYSNAQQFFTIPPNVKVTVADANGDNRCDIVYSNGQVIYNETEDPSKPLEFSPVSNVFIGKKHELRKSPVFGYFDKDDVVDLILIERLFGTTFRGTFYPGTRVRPDRDGDGLPDDWEEFFGLNPDDPNDALIDTDRDGFDNFEEFEMGTNPNLPQSPNTKPLLASLDDVIVKVGETATIMIGASDAEGDPIKIEVAGPDFVTEFSDNGFGLATLRYLPTLSDVGEHEVVIKAIDGRDASLVDEKTITLKVEASQDLLDLGGIDKDKLRPRIDEQGEDIKIILNVGKKKDISLVRSAEVSVDLKKWLLPGEDPRIKTTEIAKQDGTVDIVTCVPKNLGKRVYVRLSVKRP